MPAFFTHRAAGERVLSQLGLGSIKHNEAYYLGCQGPDILYASKQTVRNSLPLGLAMHNQKTRELLHHAMKFIKKYKKKDKDELISYLAGFIVHYSVDSSTHPFIYKRSGRNFGLHHVIEYMWDSFTSKEEWGIEIGHFDIFSDVMNAELSEGISDWYVSVAKEVYNKKLHGNTTQRAQLNFAKAKEKMFAHPGILKRIFFLLTSGVNAHDMFSAHQQDHSLFSRQDFITMEKNIVKAVNDACQLIRFMFRYIDGMETHIPDGFVDKNFLGNSLAAL